MQKKFNATYILKQNNLEYFVHIKENMVENLDIPLQNDFASCYLKDGLLFSNSNVNKFIKYVINIANVSHSKWKFQSIKLIVLTSVLVYF